MIDPIVTSDLARFGNRELGMAADLLSAWCSQKMVEGCELADGGIKLSMNTNSGFVFLHDEDGNTVMLNAEGRMENWVNTERNGEDFKSAFTKEQLEA
jgi:hypothetical protein